MLLFGSRALATARLQHAGLPTPSLLVCAEDVMSGKPEPECYLKAAELLGVRPGDCVVIEDAPAGIRAARSAGMRVVAVASTHPPEELREADAVVGSLQEIRPSEAESGEAGGGRRTRP